MPLAEQDAWAAMEDAAAQHRFRRGTCAPLPPGTDPRRAWAAAWTALRARCAAPSRVSQDEKLDILSAVAVDGGVRLHVRHFLDHDFASQYDKTETHDLVLFLRGDWVTVEGWAHAD